jgi:hypothetical protein
MDVALKLEAVEEAATAGEGKSMVRRCRLTLTNPH